MTDHGGAPLDRGLSVRAARAPGERVAPVPVPPRCSGRAGVGVGTLAPLTVGHTPAALNFNADVPRGTKISAKSGFCRDER
jgi:hypothetical protein